MNDKMQRMPGDSFTARPAEPRPEPKPEPAVEGTPDTILTRQPLKSYPMSTGRGETIGKFKDIAAGLDSSFTLSRLNDAVLMGQLTNAEANEIARHLGLDK